MISIPAQKPREVAERAKRERPIVKTGTYQLELFKAEMITDEKFGEAAFDYKKLRLIFRILNGAPKNNTPAEVEAAQLRGYGLVFSIDLKPVYSGPRQKADGTTAQASNLYSFLRTWNNGDAADEFVADPDPAIQASRLSLLLNQIVAARTQFKATIRRENINGTYKNPFSVDSLFEKVAEDELLPTWEYVRPVDPREEGDDPNVRCEVTGQQIHGFAGSDGKWISNVEAAEISKRKWGRVLCPAEIRKLKDAQRAAPTPDPRVTNLVRNRPEVVDDSEIPF